MQRTELSVPGAHCGACRAEISWVLWAVGGIADVEVDLRDRRATVHWDPAATDLTEVCETLARAGYPATPRLGDADDAIATDGPYGPSGPAPSPSPGAPTAAQPPLNPDGGR